MSEWLTFSFLENSQYCPYCLLFHFIENFKHHPVPVLGVANRSVKERGCYISLQSWNSECVFLYLYYYNMIMFVVYFGISWGFK